MNTYPMPHISTGGPYLVSPKISSGGRYHRVTTMFVYFRFRSSGLYVLASPKSANFRFPWLSINMFAAMLIWLWLVQEKGVITRHYGSPEGLTFHITMDQFSLKSMLVSPHMCVLEKRVHTHIYICIYMVHIYIPDVDKQYLPKAASNSFLCGLNWVWCCCSLWCRSSRDPCKERPYIHPLLDFCFDHLCRRTMWWDKFCFSGWVRLSVPFLVAISINSIMLAWFINFNILISLNAVTGS